MIIRYTFNLALPDFWCNEWLMKIVWDGPKRLANIAKHGLDFADAIFLDWHNAVIEPARADRHGKRRMKAIGRFVDGTAVVIFATLGTEAISLISFRAAHDKERRKLR